MRFRLLIPVILVVLGGTACSDEVGTSSIDTRGTPAAEELVKPAADIISDAGFSFASLQGYHVSLTGTDPLGPIQVDLAVNSQNQATGSVTQNGVSSQIVISGATLYIQERALAQVLLQRALPASLDAQWIRVPVAGVLNLDTLRNPTDLGQCATSGAIYLVKLAKSTVNGQPVLPINTTDDNRDDSIISVVMNDGPTYVAQWTVKAAPGPDSSCSSGSTTGTIADSGAVAAEPVGTMTFSKFNHSVEVNIPGASADAPTPVPT